MGDFAQIRKFQRNFQQKNPHEMHFNSCPHTPSEKNRDFKSPALKKSKNKKKRDFQMLKISQAVQTLNSEPAEENFHEFRPLSPDFRSSRESPISFQEKQNQMVQCPLNDPDLPPVSEIDHQSSRCYCDLCNCGSHVCPYSRRTSLYPSSVFRTQYNNSFINKGTPKQEKINVLQGYKLTNNSKIEVLTTQMQDFQPIQLPKNFNPYAEMQLNRPSTTVLPQKFCCATQYQHNFPN